MATTLRARPLGAGARLLGTLAGVVLVLAGLVCLVLGIVSYFGVQAAMHPDFRPKPLYSSVDAQPVHLSDSSGRYAIAALNEKLSGCTVTAMDGSRVAVTHDESIEIRNVYRFEAPAGDYEFACQPAKAWFQVYRGDDVRQAAQGFSGPVHPSIYYLVAMVPLFLVGNWFWQRSRRDPRD